MYKYEQNIPFLGSYKLNFNRLSFQKNILQTTIAGTFFFLQFCNSCTFLGFNVKTKLVILQLKKKRLSLTLFITSKAFEVKYSLKFSCHIPKNPKFDTWLSSDLKYVCIESQYELTVENRWGFY